MALTAAVVLTGCGGDDAKSESAGAETEQSSEDSVLAEQAVAGTAAEDTGSDIVSITPGKVAAASLTDADPSDQYRFEIAEGATLLRVELRGTGDADLYVRIGAPVLDDQINRAWDGPDILAPYLVGSDEFVEVSLPNAGTWFIRVEGFDVPAEYELIVTVE